jgi:predicted MPP superfamily phosphohydrolase
MYKFVIFILLLVFIEVYAFKGLREMATNISPIWRKVLTIAFWSTTVIAYGLLFFLILNRPNMLNYRSYDLFNFAAGFMLICLAGKLLFGSFHLFNDLANLVKWLWLRMTEKPTSEPHEKMTRVQFFNQVGLAASATLVGSMLYGVTKGKFQYRVLSEKLKYPHLPESFHGMRIVQISDMHLGSFNEQFDDVQQGFDMINELEPDYIFFTGDLVNNYSDEAEPWIERLRGLKAKYGKFSILGNHDYGDYALGPYPDLKQKHFDRLLQIHEEAGFRLLRNEHVYLERNGERIALLGTENWGLGFHQYGDLGKTMENLDASVFKVMLSHDPTFWEQHVLDKTDIALTLSGHTHGAQFGVELPSLGIKFSPVSLRYKRWGGLYAEGNQHLYINRGFGYLAFPGRVGMPPEITLLEFERA